MCVCSVDQSHLTLCDPRDCRPLGYSVQEVFWSRVLKCISFHPIGYLPDAGIERISSVYPALQVDS